MAEYNKEIAKTITLKLFEVIESLKEDFPTLDNYTMLTGAKDFFVIVVTSELVSSLKDPTKLDEALEAFRNSVFAEVEAYTKHIISIGGIEGIRKQKEEVSNVSKKDTK